jgi:hypothetical protein
MYTVIFGFDILWFYVAIASIQIAIQLPGMFKALKLKKYFCVARRIYQDKNKI